MQQADAHGDELSRLGAALADRYQIERELGRGGMATVYLARDLRHGRAVAVKVLRPELALSVGSERFLREIRVTAQLDHPHILPLLDSGEAGGVLYYVMPFVEGESLRERLDREGQLPVGDAIGIAREVADALDHAHGRGLVHRDVKPENVMLASGHARLADFGIARAVASAGAEGLTEVGMSLGTPAYMSPEQAVGEREIDGRADIYSLGCVLYEMLVGRPPFAGSSAREVLARHAIDTAPLVSAARSVPDHVQQTVERALAKAPIDRFATAAEFGRALGGESATAPAGVARGAKPRGRVLPARLRYAGLGAALLVVAVGAVWIGSDHRRRTDGAVEPALRTAIAVLPFQSLSAAPEHSYFAGGLHDELLTQLSKIAALRVISRTSVLTYAENRGSVRDIARELGVGSVVEGSVQVVGNRLRVNVQLIDVSTDSHLWAESYDRTLDDVFAIQSEIAHRVVQAVGGTLTTADRQVLTHAPTDDPDAYRLYLTGRDYAARPDFQRQDFDSAQLYFEAAIGRDPRFALAHAALSEVHGMMYWFRYDPTAARAALQRRSAQRALELAPSLPEAHRAVGLARYWGQRDFEGAIAALRTALAGDPGNARLWANYGAIQRRLGAAGEAIAAFERAAILSPRDPHLLLDVGNTYAMAGRYADAIRTYEQSARVEPRMETARLMVALTYMGWQGRTDSLSAYLTRLPAEMSLGLGGMKREWEIRLAFMERRAEDMLRLSEDARVPVFASQAGITPPALYAAWAHQLRGDHAQAREAFRLALRSLDALVQRHPDDWSVHAARGLALAGAGRRGEALREAEWLAQSPVYRTDRYEGPSVAFARARILTAVGDKDGALHELERPGSHFARAFEPLHLDPRFDSLRNHPRFRAIVAQSTTAVR